MVPFALPYLLATTVAMPLAAQCPDGQPSCPRSVSLAVLYFDNATRDSADRALVEAITEEVIDRLAGVGRFNVRNRHAVAAWRERRAADPAQAGRALGVKYVVTGTFRRFGARIRVSAELLDPATGRQLWSDRFEQPAIEALELIGSLSSEIATRVLGRLQPVERASVRRGATRDIRAFEHFASANFLMRNRNEERIRQAIGEYRAAFTRDPQYAAAVGRFALAHAVLVHWAPVRPAQRDSILREGRSAADRAIALDPSSSDAWLARGYLRVTAGGAEQAAGLADLERAVALDPENAEAWHQLGSARSAQGAVAAAESAFARALAIDTSRFITTFEFAVLLRDVGRLGEAVRVFDRAAELERIWHWSQTAERITTVILAGDSARAARLLLANRGGAPLDTTNCLVSCILEGLLAASHGDTARARRLVGYSAAHRSRMTMDPIRAEGCNHWLMSLLIVGERRRALHALSLVEPSRRRAIELRHPGCASLRTEPEYARLLAESSP